MFAGAFDIVNVIATRTVNSMWLRGIAMVLRGFKLQEMHRALATEPTRQPSTQTTDSPRSRSPQTA
jgi:hypothetical protein